jgi:hypothetical protein
VSEVPVRSSWPDGRQPDGEESIYLYKDFFPPVRENDNLVKYKIHDIFGAKAINKKIT